MQLQSFKLDCRPEPRPGSSALFGVDDCDLHACPQTKLTWPLRADTNPCRRVAGLGAVAGPRICKQRLKGLRLRTMHRNFPGKDEALLILSWGELLHIGLSLLSGCAEAPSSSRGWQRCTAEDFALHALQLFRPQTQNTQC